MVAEVRDRRMSSIYYLHFGCGLRHDVSLLLILTVEKELLRLVKASESEGPAAEPGL